MINETEVLDKIKKQNLIDYFKKFSKLTGLTIRFEILADERVRARNEYKQNTHEFIIYLGQKWREMDLAHELIHGEIMFIDKYGVISCSSVLCQLLRDYIEDVAVHKHMLNKFKIVPFDEEYTSRIMGLARDLFRGKKVIVDSYWDQYGLVCNQLHKALLYVQAWHFNHLFNNTKFDKFLVGFRKTYQQKKEIELADKIIEICKTNNYLEDKSGYEKAITEIIGIYKPILPNEKLIKHYEKNNSGFSLV